MNLRGREVGVVENGGNFSMLGRELWDRPLHGCKHSSAYLRGCKVYHVDDLIVARRKNIAAGVMPCLRDVSRATLSSCCGRTTLSRSHTWPSPPSRAKHGCLSWAFARLHILTVVSSDAEAMMYGLAGEVARSLMPCVPVS